MQLINISGKASSLVDVEDWLLFAGYNWYLRKTPKNIYVLRKENVKGKTVYHYLHRDIARCPKDYETHHINGNTLDNRRANLINVLPQWHRFITRASKKPEQFKSVPTGHKENNRDRI